MYMRLVCGKHVDPFETPIPYHLKERQMVKVRQTAHLQQESEHV